jgi:lycopene beta-cyclase
MDFQLRKGNTRFMYVLPTSPTEALLEYTLFSHDLLAKAEYETAIKEYIAQLNYQLLHNRKEQGSIPMTCYPFWKKIHKSIEHWYCRRLDKGKYRVYI